MTLSSFTSWLRHRSDALVDRCVAALERRRMRRARAQLSLRVREKADFWRARYLTRKARLQREREARAARRTRPADASEVPAMPDISKADVLAAIARSRANREARLKARQEQGPR